MRILITTPIYYTNAKPHLGHAFTTICGDYISRMYKSLGYDVFFLTGTDEHGKKIELAAKKENKSPKEFVDEIVEEYLESWRKLAEETLAMLSSNSFKAHIVTIPEWLSIVQTERLVKELTAFKVNIGKLIVNQVALDDQARKAMHQKYLSMLKEKFGFLEIIAIPVQRYELRGLNNLLKFSTCLADVIPF